MNVIFDLDNPFFRFLGRLVDLVVLNLLFLLCCIPIITIGPALAALYYTTIRLVMKRSTYVTADFSKSFKENLKQGIIIWLIVLAVGAVIAEFINIWYYADSSFRNIMFILGGAVAAIFLEVVVWVFPVLSKFGNPVRLQFRNAFIFAVKYFPLSILSVVIIGLVVLACYVAPVTLFALVVFGFSLIALIESWYYAWVFKKYFPEEVLEQDEMIQQEEEIAKKEAKKEQTL